MARDGIPLPSALSGVISERVIRIDDALIFLIAGALAELADNWQFEQTGTLTVDDVKLALSEMLWCYLEDCDVHEIGEIGVFAGLAAKSKWLPCDGAAVSRATYSGLFARIGTKYGIGNGTTTFNVPNMKGKSPVGIQSGSPEGTAYGNAAQSLVTGQLPAHSHTVTDPGHVHLEQVGSTPAYLATGGTGRTGFSAVTTSNTTRVTSDSNTTGITIANTGSGGSIDMYHPVVTVPYFIYTGVP